MSPPTPDAPLAADQLRASVFAALGDATRLSLVNRLADGQPRSIAQLSEGYPLSRQAITKHLGVLESAGILHRVRSGRESLFEFDAGPMRDLSSYLEAVSRQWDAALGRLKAFIAENP
ncbi:ArsR/SmtB family transcription factor [Verrucomicrobium spinosum]|uniref:ArsR/SmtB family transcription factor n=1 Tax=Verrucomicrobium spinosum TaxID=2736 RepID=UPI000174562C|nr:metalloregulator ArsR/SmtB family transcription factor [Verrucomicrobium spinosum]